MESKKSSLGSQKEESGFGLNTSVNNLLLKKKKDIKQGDQRAQQQIIERLNKMLEAFTINEHSQEKCFAYNFIIRFVKPMAQRHLLPQTDENYYNPARKHIKRNTQKSKNIQQTPLPGTTTPQHHHPPNTHNPLRFRDLSKDRPQYYTQLNKQSSQNSFNHANKQSAFASIRRKLFDSGSNREKSVSFSDLIKLSREKRLRDESPPRESIIIQQGSTKKEGKAFNALKARLMGENNPNASNVIASKPAKSQQQSCKMHVARQKNVASEQLDMVRVSMQVDFSMMRESLEMTPL